MTLTNNINEWETHSLLEKEYKILGEFENVQSTAWSSVSRIQTTSGYVYLKQTPPLLSLESATIQTLYHKFHANVPIIIDTNDQLKCFLMQDAGKAFYFFNDHANRRNIILDGITCYKNIQNNSISLVNDFIKLGVPDWRIKNLSMLYKNLISQENLLIEDGFPNDEINNLSFTLDKCITFCEQLEKFQIAETLDHCDLHGGNILIDEKNHAITIIDWGETVITHPFLSLSFLLRGLVKYYSFQENELWNVIFENNIITNKDELSALASLAKKMAL